MNNRILILVPSTWNDTERGNYFEDLVADLFRQMQFKVTERVRVTGMEIDLLAENIHSKEMAYVECKFLADSFGSPIITKLVGSAVSRNEINIAYLVTTAEPGKDAKGLLAHYESQGNRVRDVLRFAYIGPSVLTNLFLDVKGLPRLDVRLASIDPDFREDISSATLVITPAEACWVLEQQKSGMVQSACALPADPRFNRLKNYDAFKELIDDNKTWQGLRIVNGFPDMITPAASVTESRLEVITQIPVAEKFDDYAPARPRDFVGRSDLQREIFGFLEKVRTGQSQRRILALSGASGFGKSSVVLKLADKARNKRRGKKFFFYHIDSRSATGPLFVVEAIRKAFQNAIDEQFIETSEKSVRIDSVENPFASESVIECLGYLKSQQRVLVIFFDQFEEMFTKESLFSTFEVFTKVAFLIESLEPNVVLGFSWRTGIAFSEDHPAYHMWHSLQDKRAEFRIGLFSEHEASEMVRILEKNASVKLENSLRRHILEQAQGFPWLLKKLCIHIYRQLQQGGSQRALVERQLEAAILFQEDTSDLSPIELRSLKYIAENSPAELVAVQELFGPDVIDHLYGARLIIKSGYKYSVYWDIFREYLIDGKVPDIPVTYFPQAHLQTALTVLRFIVGQGPVSLEEIQKNFKYTQRTVWNILGDLSAFFLVTRGDDDRYKAIGEVANTVNFEIAVARYVAGHLRRHVVLQTFYQEVSTSEDISQPDFERIIAEVYPSMSRASLHVYMNRIVSWLRFAGLVEMESPDLLIRPTIEGKEIGRVVIRHPQLIDGKAVFFCTSGPSQVIKLATELCYKMSLTRKDIEGNANRNAAQDLTSLGLAEWTNKSLCAINALASVAKSNAEDLRVECVSVVKSAALNSRFLMSLSKHLASDANSTNEEIITIVSQELGRVWRPASAQRYLSGGIRWLQYFGVIQKLHGQMSLPDVFDVLED